jgi:hypothetical protein
MTAGINQLELRQNELFSGAVAISGNVEELRIILTREQRREVDLAEATDIGQSLIDFYEALAEVPEVE